MKQLKFFILRLIGIDTIWDFVLSKTEYQEECVSTEYMQRAFIQVPELAGTLRTRKLNLLKSVMLDEKTNRSIRGHIEEIEFWLRFDIPNKQVVGKVEEPKLVLPHRKSFLEAWNKDAKKEKEQAIVEQNKQKAIKKSE